MDCPRLLHHPRVETADHSSPWAPPLPYSQLLDPLTPWAPPPPSRLTRTVFHYLSCSTILQFGCGRAEGGKRPTSQPGLESTWSAVVDLRIVKGPNGISGEMLGIPVVKGRSGQLGEVGGSEGDERPRSIWRAMEQLMLVETLRFVELLSMV